MKAPDRGHLRALLTAASRRSVIRYEQVGSKTVMVKYSLVHSNNDKELMRARQKLERINEARAGRSTLKLVTE